MLISSLRGLSAREREGRILREKRKIASSRETEPHVRHSNILKSIYMRLLSHRVSEIDFLNACESDVLRIKSAGYLGLMAMDSDEYVIMAINTIMKDLGKRETRNDALTAICNLGNDGLALSNLASHVCPNGKGDFHKKALVAFFRLNPDAKVSVVGQDPSEVYVKAQIMVDASSRTGAIDLTENDVLFLVSLFIKSNDPFLKIKLLQVFGILHSKGLLALDRNLLNAIDAVVIPSRDKARLQVEIALAIEAVELLLKTGHPTPKADAFVLRLIESQNPNSRYFGLRMARRYKVHREIAIDRCIKLGLHRDLCLRTLVSLVAKGNHRSVYKRKEEIIFYMEKEGAAKQTVNMALATVFSKLAQYAKDDLLVRMYQEVPEVCLRTCFDKNVPKNCMLKLFNKISVTVNSRYFPLIYQLMQPGMKNEEFYSMIFERHLNILVIKASKGQELATLSRLLDCMLSFGIPSRNCDILVSKYREVAGEDDSEQVLDMFLNTIYLLNPRLEAQAIHVASGCFIFFSLPGEHAIELRTDPGLKVRSLTGDGLAIEKVDEGPSDSEVFSYRAKKPLSKVCAEVSMGTQVYMLELETG